jgi:predicted GNAT family acetyltransferase
MSNCMVCCRSAPNGEARLDGCNKGANVEILIVDNVSAQRFEATVDRQLCVLDYRIDGHTLLLNHAGVPDAVGGRGIAAALTRFALESARQRGMAVVPNCSYVAAWIRRHPAYADLVRIDS